MTKEFVKGFSRANLYNMRLLYITYEKIQTLSGKLSWSHYCELLLISDEDKNKEKVMELDLQGNEINEPADIICNLYVFEFLGLHEDKPMMKSDLGKVVAQQIEKWHKEEH